MTNFVPFTRVQCCFLVGVGGIFALQLLPHWFTGLLNNPFGFFYPLLAAVLGLFILVATAITLLMWVLTLTPDSRVRRRNWFATFACSLIIGIGLSAISVAYDRGLPTGSFRKPFNQRVWATPSSSEFVDGDITERQKMLGDVVTSIVAGGDKESILAKLGPSEDVGYFASSGRDLIYRTGPQRDSVFAIDSEWLLIWFDANGRTLRYEIRSD